MGKIRITTLGGTEEKELIEKQKTRREEKKKREKAEKIHIAGMKGGERIKTVGASEEELEKLAKITEEVEKDQAEGIKETEEKEEKKAKKKPKKIRSKNYKSAVMKLEHNKIYPFKEAIPLLRQISLTKFDPTVEVHINTIEKGLSGRLTLPHGTGRKIKIEIADNTNIDKLVEKVEKGKIDFDALVAHPSVMAKLARVAKFLGPRGLMPNPKMGTISSEPEKVAERLNKGELFWKTEADFPIIHQVIGKLSFKDSQLGENFEALIKSITEAKIKNITLKSTMSPGIKISLE